MKPSITKLTLPNMWEIEIVPQSFTKQNGVVEKRFNLGVEVTLFNASGEVVPLSGRCAHPLVSSAADLSLFLAEAAELAWSDDLV